MGIDDRIEAEIDQIKGKAKEEAGEKLGDRSTEWEGKAEKKKGDLQESWEDVKDAAREAGE